MLQKNTTNSERKLEAVRLMYDKVIEIVKKYNHERGHLVGILQDIQGEYRYLPKEALTKVAELLGIPLSRVYNVATFFRAFSLKPRGKHLINVCLGTACHVRGAVKILEKLEMSLGVGQGETTTDGKFTVETVNCMGCCALGPVIKVNETYYGNLKVDKIDSILSSYE